MVNFSLERVNYCRQLQNISIQNEGDFLPLIENLFSRKGNKALTFMKDGQFFHRTSDYEGEVVAARDMKAYVRVAV
jgi:hypothetical protein